MRSKKYMAIKESYWKMNHKGWYGNARQGMMPNTAYEVVRHTLDDSGPFYNGVVVYNYLKDTKAFFEVVDVYEVTPQKNPEYFL
jgi:hypothetical protein